jgi:hypothetical protein
LLFTVTRGVYDRDNFRRELGNCDRRFSAYPSAKRHVAQTDCFQAMRERLRPSSRPQKSVPPTQPAADATAAPTPAPHEETVK